MGPYRSASSSLWLSATTLGNALGRVIIVGILNYGQVYAGQS
jgi:hypothetical protein